MIGFINKMTVLKGIYRHVASGLRYKVVGVGRSVDNPTQLVVIYKQLYASKLKGTNENLKKGSIWIRKYEEFISVDDKGIPKFTKI